MKSSDLRLIFVLVIVALGVQALCGLAPRESVWAALPFLQTICFPLLFLVFWRLAILGGGIPRRVLVLAALCAIGAAAFSFAWRGDRGTDFLIARLRGDIYEAESKIFRDRINDAIPTDSGVRAVRYYRELENFSESQRALRSNRSVPAIVWGGAEWISVSFRTGDPVVRLGDFAPSLPFGGDFMLVTHLSRLDISRRPEQPTAAFLAKTLAGLLPERIVNGVRLPAGGPSAELALKDGGQIIERWKGFAHRGFAAFALANYYLIAAVSSNLSDRELLRCAISMYVFGRKRFRGAENPELAMALANNEGVARMLLAVVSGDRVEAGRARKLWRSAAAGPSNLKRLVGAPYGRLAAWMNQSADRSVGQRREGRRVRSKTAAPLVP